MRGAHVFRLGDPDDDDRRSGELTRDADEFELELYATAQAEAPLEWWQHAYAGGEPVGPANLIRPLYFPGNPAGKPASVDGPDVLAVKRAVWRGGRWQGPASRFDDAYSRSFALGCGPNVVDTGLAGFQRQMKIQASGQMGDPTYQAMRYARVPEGFPHAGEPLFDAYAVDLLEKARDCPPGAEAPEDARAAIADYCRRTIANEPKWHYVQQRPMTTLGDSPDAGGESDCSEHATAAYYWAGAPDPNRRSYDGYGYTGTLINNPEVYAPYKVGDLALYGSSYGATEHVCTCMKAGDDGSARWCSHGSEGAPCEVALMYRGDLLCVVRPAIQ